MVGRTDPLCPRQTPQDNMLTSAICLIFTPSCPFSRRGAAPMRGYFFVLEVTALLNIVRSTAFAIAL